MLIDVISLNEIDFFRHVNNRVLKFLFLHYEKILFAFSDIDIVFEFSNLLRFIISVE